MTNAGELQGTEKETIAPTCTTFTTDFWTSLISESFVTVSMHWITRDWCLKTRILGTMHFPKKHTTVNIFERFLNARIDFGVWSKDGEGRTPESEETLRCDKLVYFGMEPPLDRPVLTSDCGSNVFAGAKKNSLWDWNRCACHCSNVAMQSALKRPCIQKFVEPLVELARKFSKSRSLWMEFTKVQLEMLHWEAE